VGKLDDKICVVTGGGSGIGLAVTRAFLAEGARVAIAGRTESRLRQAAKQLGEESRLMYSAVDVADPDQVQLFFKGVRQRFGVVNILVNNAGLNIKERAIRQLDPEHWQKLIRANLDGAFFSIHAVLPDMLERRDGLIINIASIAALRPSPLGGAGYAAAKAGMRALGTCLAAEERNNGIRVCNICPGEVETPILEERPVPLTQEQRKQILQPEDVAAAVLFVSCLPPRAAVPELIIKPAAQLYA
jgi:NADP-dependent 3-hydroxy acid dehydrogenase YdfG